MKPKKTNREATINAGVGAVMLHDAGIAQRQQFAATSLTARGVEIYHTARAEQGEEYVRQIVTRAVDAGY